MVTGLSQRIRIFERTICNKGSEFYNVIIMNKDEKLNKWQGLFKIQGFFFEDFEIFDKIIFYAKTIQKKVDLFF